MATSVFFNNFKSSMEQTLLEDLIIEAIRIYGEDMWYIPRTLNNKDEIYGEDSTASFEEAILVELYIKSVDGFTGDGNFMSKFGLEIRDQVTFVIAKRIFESDVGQNGKYVRPREGDIIYFPLNNKPFQIRYVNNKEFFYQLGALQTYELTCELFEYSDEVFNTGIPEIDAIQVNLSTNILDYAIVTEDGFMLALEDDDLFVTEDYEDDIMDVSQDNDEIQTESEDFLDFSESDPFSDSGRF